MRGLMTSAAMLVLLGCGSDLPPQWQLDEYRVLGVVASPPEVSPDGSVELTLVDFEPAGEAVTYQWSVCLFSLGSVTNFKCVDPQLETALEEDGPGVTLDFGPDGLGLRALYALFGPIPNAAGEPQTLEDGFEVYVHVVSRSGDREESTYKRVRIRDGDPLNTNPKTQGFTIDGEPPAPVKRDQSIKIRIVPDDSAPELDPEGLEEGYIYQWFATDGAMEDESDFGVIPSIDYTTPKDPGIYPVFVVIRDQRGGTTVERLDLIVQ